MGLRFVQDGGETGCSAWLVALEGERNGARLQASNWKANRGAMISRPAASVLRAGQARQEAKAYGAAGLSGAAVWAALPQV